MSKILDTITNFFARDSVPHHFFTLESTQLNPDVLGDALQGPDISYIFNRHYDNFGIKDARVLIDLQNEKTEKMSVYIIAFTTITAEAQNALLKALEEPRPNKTFFFIVANLKNLVPALQSRTYVLYDESEKTITETKIDVNTFINEDVQKRFEMIKAATDKKLKDDEKLSKTDVVQFLNNLELHFHQKKNMTVLRKIAAARNYMHAKGASRKMILEDLAMTIDLII